jgi:uncharacterized protein (DUF2267 family)
MSAHTTLPQFARSNQKAQEWLNELTDAQPFANQEQAYSILRATLHALRDRLTPEEVAHFGSQFPMILRGAYFEGWRPARAPNAYESADEFKEQVRASLGTGDAGVTELDTAILATLEFLSDRVDAGEMRHVTGQLPEAIAALFPAEVRAGAGA